MRPSGEICGSLMRCRLQHRVDIEGLFLRKGARREREQRDEFTTHTPRL